MPRLTLALSPCPNDTFIFDAMLHQKIDTEGYAFEPVFADVEELNRAALVGRYAISKLSYHAFAYASAHYVLLRSGSALGNNCGPLLISTRPMSDAVVHQARIAVPGKYTTANFLFSLRYPEAKHKEFMLFSAIEDSILAGKVDAGVIIHENRFTYQDKGLIKIIDLGEYWEQTYKAPIPLGGIAIKRSFDLDTQLAVERIIRRSIEYAFAHPASSQAFVQAHSQEMSEAVCRMHIDLYVNAYSVELGPEGEAAVRTLYRVAGEKQVIPPLSGPLFPN